MLCKVRNSLRIESNSSIYQIFVEKQIFALTRLFLREYDEINNGEFNLYDP